MITLLITLLATAVCCFSPSGYSTVLGSMAFFLLLTKFELPMVMVASGFNFDLPVFLLVLLSVWVTLLMVMAMALPSSSPSLLLTLTALLLCLFLAFSAHDLVWFYIFFEASLLPTFALILGWGYQPERIQAGVYMLLYTVLASLPLLVALLSLKY